MKLLTITIFLLFAIFGTCSAQRGLDIYVRAKSVDGGEVKGEYFYPAQTTVAEVGQWFCGLSGQKVVDVKPHIIGKFNLGKSLKDSGIANNDLVRVECE